MKRTNFQTRRDKAVQECDKRVRKSRAPPAGPQEPHDCKSLTKWAIVIMLIVAMGYFLCKNVMSIGKSLKKPPRHVAEEELLKDIEMKSAFQSVWKQRMMSGSKEKTNDNCDALVAHAADLMQLGPTGYDPALDMLARCALQNATHSGARWNMAVILMKADRKDEALYHMQAAAEIEPDNMEYCWVTGSLMMAREMYELGVVMLERYCELKLGVDRFSDLLEQIAGSPSEDLQFLVAEGNQLLGALDKLLMAYLRQKWLRKSDCLYQVLVNIYPNDIALHSSYAFFAIGIGKIATGIHHLRCEMELKFIEQKMGSEDDAFGVIEAHSLRLLTTGFDSHIVNIGRNILFSAGEEIITLIAENCGSDVINIIGEAKLNVSLSQLREVFVMCLSVQKVLGPLLKVKGSLFSENQFGWNAFLHAALLGDIHVLQQFILSKADVKGHTFLGQTSLHVAAIRGHYELCPVIMAEGLNPDSLDYYSRSALDIACLHHWSVAGFSNSIGRHTNCSMIPMYDSKPSRSLDSSYFHPGFKLPLSLTSERCDFDVRLGLMPEEFLRDYLSIQRPVLIRNGIGNWANLRHKWQRSNMDAKYGKLSFKRVIIPYANENGLNASIVTLHDFLLELMSLHASQLTSQQPGDFLTSLPPYIFDSLSSESPLMADFAIPAVLDPKVTQITTQTVHFYIGPPLSGTPVHFHRSAWNALVHGKKRWFLYPPRTSLYSKQHIWLWYNDVYLDRQDALECVQSAGDVIFVPDLWAHGVVNLQETVGFASEFIYGSSEFSL